MNPPQTPTQAPRDQPVHPHLERAARWLVWPYWCGLAASTHWPNLSVVPPPPEEPHPLHQIAKLDIPIHITCFGGLMLLILIAGIGTRKKTWERRCLVSLCIALSYATVDELTQHFSEGRSVSWSDLLANFIGILSVYVLAMLPARHTPPPRSRRLILTIVLMLPFILSAMLFPRVIQWAREAASFLTDAARYATHPGDYIFHGIVAMTLSILTIVAWPMCSKRPRLNGGIAIFLLFMAGPAIEVMQHFTGRGVQPEDVQAHTIGVLVAMIWWSIRLNQMPHLRESIPTT